MKCLKQDILHAVEEGYFVVLVYVNDKFLLIVSDDVVILHVEWSLDPEEGDVEGRLTQFPHRRETGGAGTDLVHVPVDGFVGDIFLRHNTGKFYFPNGMGIDDFRVFLDEIFEEDSSGRVTGIGLRDELYPVYFKRPVPMGVAWIVHVGENDLSVRKLALLALPLKKSWKGFIAHRNAFFTVITLKLDAFEVVLRYDLREIEAVVVYIEPARLAVEFLVDEFPVKRGNEFF